MNSVVCIKCESGFIVVGGICLPSTNYNNIQCQVQDCQYCIFNNYCGLCKEGYRVLPNSGGACVRLLEIVANCWIVNPSFVYSNLCKLCKDGYLNVGGLCYAFNISVSCNITGCNYCLYNNSCQLCMGGYSLLTSDTGSSICAPLCSIDNC